MIAAALGYAAVPRSVASWKHGVSYEREFEFPELLLTEGNRATRHLVANDWQVRGLRKRGFTRVHAVGAPFLYVGPSGAGRMPGSLLVMPAHSVFNASHAFDEDGYADLVCSIRDRFSAVVACIGAASARKGEWTRAFERKGIPWVTGADSSDRNGLRRMARIFGTFEYVTTNFLGSHVAYAAHLDCKVSVWGLYAQYRLEDFKGVPWFQKNWSKLARRTERWSEEYVRSKHPELFKNPWDAALLREWAEPFLGIQHKRELPQLAELLGWSPIGQVEVRVHDGAKLCVNVLKAAMRRIRRLIPA